MEEKSQLSALRLANKDANESGQQREKRSVESSSRSLGEAPAGSGPVQTEAFTFDLGVEVVGVRGMVAGISALPAASGRPPRTPS